MMKFEKEYVLARFKQKMKLFLDVEAKFAEDIGNDAYGFTTEQAKFYSQICDVFKEFVDDAELAENVDKPDIDEIPF